MSPTEPTTPSGDAAQADQDLGPLAWVLEELRKSLDSAAKATRRFVREAQEVRESDLAALDSSPLRMAKQHLHQASGALEMVGMPQVALLLRAMESAVQHYVQHPGDCTEAVALTLEKSSCALLEFLEAVLAGKHVAAVALFPQYRDVHALFWNQGKVHPADLWPIERRLRDPELPRQVPALDYLPEQRKILDTAVLQIVKGQDIALASTRVCDVCLGFAQAQTETSMRVFWKVAAAYFDAMAHGLLNADIYGKRMASRVLMVCAALAKGDPVAPERLLQDMLFFCAQAGKDPQVAQAATIWYSVYSSFGLQRHAAVDYEQASFGRFDPALLEQARKRMGAATEIWSALAGGDINKLKPAVDQFTLVCDSLVKLHPESHGLANALAQVTHSVAATGQPPSAEIAMEVATAVLYLQAAFASLDMADAVMASHSETLTQRLTAVLAGQASQPLAPWMEQLYRQVSDQQTMGSVLGELRGTLGETEKLLDQYFRNPAEKRRARHGIRDGGCNHRACTPAWSRRKRGTSSQAIGRIRGGLTTKILALTDALGNLVRFVLLPGQRHDLQGVSELLQDIDLQALLADKAFDANWLVGRLQNENCQVVIAQKTNRTEPLIIDSEMYKWRHLIENYFCKLKEFKRIALRSDKTDSSEAAVITLVSAVINSR